MPPFITGLRRQTTWPRRWLGSLAWARRIRLLLFTFSMYASNKMSIINFSAKTLESFDNFLNLFPMFHQLIFLDVRLVIHVCDTSSRTSRYSAFVSPSENGVGILYDGVASCGWQLGCRHFCRKSRGIRGCTDSLVFRAVL